MPSTLYFGYYILQLLQNQVAEIYRGIGQTAQLTARALRIRAEVLQQEGVEIPEHGTAGPELPHIILHVDGRSLIFVQI